MRPRPVRHYLSHQRDSHCEFTPHSQTCNETIEGKIPETHRQRTQSGAKRINQNRYHHRASTANPVAEDTKSQSASGPANQKNRGRIPAILGNALPGMEQSFHGGNPREIEELLVETIEEPP